MKKFFFIFILFPFFSFGQTFVKQDGNVVWDVKDSGTTLITPPVGGVMYGVQRQYGPPYFSTPAGETDRIPDNSDNSGYDFFLKTASFTQNDRYALVSSKNTFTYNGNGTWQSGPWQFAGSFWFTFTYAVNGEQGMYQLIELGLEPYPVYDVTDPEAGPTFPLSPIATDSPLFEDGDYELKPPDADHNTPWWEFTPKAADPDVPIPIGKTLVYNGVTGQFEYWDNATPERPWVGTLLPEHHLWLVEAP